MTQTTTIWTADAIKAEMSIENKAAEQVMRANRWVLKGLIAIYQCQTQDEKSSAATLEHNGIGFNGVDAEILSSFALQAIQRNSLSIKQLEIARRKMVKYAKQLARIANGEIEKPEVES